MILVSGSYFSLEDQLVHATTAVSPMLSVVLLLDQGQQPSWVEECSQEVGGHFFPSLQSHICTFTRNTVTPMSTNNIITSFFYSQYIITAMLC